MRFLLDTHAILWAVENDSRLGKGARKELQDCEAGDIAICTLTLFEISMLHNKKRIKLALPLTEYLQGLEQRFNVLPVFSIIAKEATTLPLPHSDPFDRIITATARYHKLPLITKDRQIATSGLVDTIW